MSNHSRREFLVRSAAAGTALAFGAQKLVAQQPASKKMTIAKWTGATPTGSGQIDQIATQLTEKAIAGLGGMQRFVRRGDVVWVKPNIAWDRAPELAANTNPALVAAIVRLCFDAGAKVVKVGDNPCHQVEKTYVSTGIPAAAKTLGAKIVQLDRRRFRSTAIKEGERVKELLLYPEILDADIVINIPIGKHHRLAGLTMCMKNYMGVMDNRKPFHQAIDVCLADLTRFMQQRRTLYVLDCVRVLNDHGPSGGDPKDVMVKTTIAAGVDPVALDSFGAELMGRKPQDITSIVKGNAVGLGTMNYRSLGPQEIAVS